MQDIQPAIANAAAPTYAEGSHIPLSTTLQGVLRTTVVGGGGGGTASVDEDPFTIAVSSGTPVMGVVNPVDFVPNGELAIAAMDDRRNLKVVSGPNGVNVNINDSGGAALLSDGSGDLYVAMLDGSDQTEGAIGDAAVYGDNDGTVSAKLRGINKELADAFQLATPIRNQQVGINTTELVDAGGNGVTVTGNRLDVNASVTLPTNVSVNVAQVAGNTTSVNSGAKDNGTLRVVIATDQPQLTNKLLVTPDSVALPANQSVNVSQLAGTATDTNSGNKSNGTLRVVLATDQPALATAMPTSNATQDGAYVAPGAATPSKLNTIGGIVQIALPAPQADTKAVQMACDKYGRPKVTGPQMTLASSDATPITTATGTIVVAAPAANFHLRIYYVMANNSSATACRVSWRDGAAGVQRYPATLCQYSTFAHNIKPGYWDLTSATALYLTTSATGSIDWTVEYEVVND
jgi:hypothetical protein